RQRDPSNEVTEEAKSPDEVFEEKVKEMMQLVPIKEVYVEALHVKHPIIDWKDKEIFMLMEKDYPLRKGLALVMISYKLQVKNYSQTANDLILKIYKIANSPRQQGIEFPLAEEVPTTSEEGCHCQKKRDATAKKIALLLKSRRNCQSKSNDSFAKVEYKRTNEIDNYLGGDVFDLIGDVVLMKMDITRNDVEMVRIHACFRDELDNVVKEEDGGWICFLGGNNSSGTKKYQGSNSGDGGNIGDGVKITGGVIGFGGRIGDAMARRTSMARKRKVVIVKAELIVISDSLDDSNGPSIPKVLVYGLSIQGLLEKYGYDNIKDYLSDFYFPSTDKEDSIVHINSSYDSKGVSSNGPSITSILKEGPSITRLSKEPIPKEFLACYGYDIVENYLPVAENLILKVIFKSPNPIKRCVLRLANVETWDNIVKKYGMRTPGICVDKSKGKRKIPVTGCVMGLANVTTWDEIEKKIGLADGFAAVLAVLITGAYQRRKHGKSESLSYCLPNEVVNSCLAFQCLDTLDLTNYLPHTLFDVGSRRISIVIVNTFKYHSDVLAISQG
nr:hypothetical protein [Tanacetum cinerariifolium]